MTASYQARFERVLRHIDEHPAEDLSVDRLSDVARVSKFHFHRQFAALFGIGTYRYVQLVRLKRASYQLAFRTEPILEIALDAGYEGPEAFCRTFKQRFGQTPTAFRQQPQWTSWHDVYLPIRAIRRSTMKQGMPERDVRIVETKDVRVAVLEHRGDPAKIGDSIRSFIAWRKTAGLPPRNSATFNVLYDNPDNTPPENFRLDLCAATDRAVAPNDAGILAKVIPGGRCAVLRHVGTEESFADAALYLYAGWLPGSGEELRDFPLYCQRISFFPDVPEHEGVTDLFLPLK
ncbi:MAG TPA: AraC family transcriptional regulator [Dongiaceae bacterium]|nr:AraC family transcriptional regulator [Dongiaceae bacterium]